MHRTIQAPQSIRSSAKSKSLHRQPQRRVQLPLVQERNRLLPERVFRQRHRNRTVDQCQQCWRRCVVLRPLLGYGCAVRVVVVHEVDEVVSEVTWAEYGGEVGAVSLHE